MWHPPMLQQCCRCGGHSVLCQRAQTNLPLGSRPGMGDGSRACSPTLDGKSCFQGVPTPVWAAISPFGGRRLHQAHTQPRLSHLGQPSDLTLGCVAPEGASGKVPTTDTWDRFPIHAVPQQGTPGRDPMGLPWLPGPPRPREGEHGQRPQGVVLTELVFFIFFLVPWRLPKGEGP